MSNIVQFNPTQLPAFARTGALSETAKALAGGSAGQTGKRVSIKGGVFRLIHDGKEVASIEDRHVDVVMVKAAPKVAPKPAAKRTAKPVNDAIASIPTADSEANIKQGLIDACVDLIQHKLDRTMQISWIADKATKWDLDEPGSKLAQMTIDQLQSCIDELGNKPDLKK